MFKNIVLYLVLYYTKMWLVCDLNWLIIIIKCFIIISHYPQKNRKKSWFFLGDPLWKTADPDQLKLGAWQYLLPAWRKILLFTCISCDSDWTLYAGHFHAPHIKQQQMELGKQVPLDDSTSSASVPHNNNNNNSSSSTSFCLCWLPMRCFCLQECNWKGRGQERVSDRGVGRRGATNLLHSPIFVLQGARAGAEGAWRCGQPSAAFVVRLGLQLSLFLRFSPSHYVNFHTPARTHTHTHTVGLLEFSFTSFSQRFPFGPPNSITNHDWNTHNALQSANLTKIRLYSNTCGVQGANQKGKIMFT